MPCSSRATARKGKVPIPWQVPGKRGSLGQGRTQLALLAEKALALTVQELLLNEALLANSIHNQGATSERFSAEALLVLCVVSHLSACVFFDLSSTSGDRFVQAREISGEKKQI